MVAALVLALRLAREAPVAGLAHARAAHALAMAVAVRGAAGLDGHLAAPRAAAVVAVAAGLAKAHPGRDAAARARARAWLGLG